MTASEMANAILTSHARPEPKPEPRYDVNASVHEMDGDGSDGAYDLILRNATPAEIAAQLQSALEGAGFGLTNSDGPFRLSIHIGPAGRGDDLPL